MKTTTPRRKLRLSTQENTYRSLAAIEDEILQKVEEQHASKLQKRAVSSERYKLAQKLKSAKAAHEKLTLRFKQLQDKVQYLEIDMTTANKEESLLEQKYATARRTKNVSLE